MTSGRCGAQAQQNTREGSRQDRPAKARRVAVRQQREAKVLKGNRPDDAGGARRHCTTAAWKGHKAHGRRAGGAKRAALRGAVAVGQQLHVRQLAQLQRGVAQVRQRGRPLAPAAVGPLGGHERAARRAPATRPATSPSGLRRGASPTWRQPTWGHMDFSVRHRSCTLAMRGRHRQISTADTAAPPRNN